MADMATATAAVPMEMQMPTATSDVPMSLSSMSFTSMHAAHNRTKKQKTVSSKQVTKKLMWGQVDEMEGKSQDVECLYRASPQRESCELCQTPLVLLDEGFQGCPNKACGVVYTDVLDQGPEWRFFAADDQKGSDPTRCGMPINDLLEESSYSLKVNTSCRSSYEMRKLSRYNNWMTPYREKARYDVFQRISVLAEQGGIPKIIIDDAMRYHKKISEAKTFRGVNRDGIIAATIYISAKINNFPRTAKEIAAIFNLDHTSATRGCKNAMTIINEIEHEMAFEDKTALCSTTPMSFIERYCSRLQINMELTKVCMFVAMKIEQHNMIPENTPPAIAAGIVYFVAQACNINVSKKAVNGISDISEVTINKCFKKLEAKKDELIPPVILEKYKPE